MQANGWSVSGGNNAVSWDGTQDVDGQANSGSLRLDNGGPGIVTASQCLDLGPGQYTLSVWVLVQMASERSMTSAPSDPETHSWSLRPSHPVAVSTWVRVGGYDAPNCDEGFSGDSIESSSLLDPWEQLTIIYTAPAGTESIEVSVSSFNSDDTDTVIFVSSFDDVSLVPEPSMIILQISVLVTLALFARYRVTDTRPRRNPQLSGAC